MHKAHNNDEGYPEDVGFATTGGIGLAQLGQVMFKAAQAIKPNHCNWHLVGNQCYSVWTIVETEIHHPAPGDQTMCPLDMHNVFPRHIGPFALNERQINELLRICRRQRRAYVERSAIPAIDQPGDDTDHDDKY